jgi:hypothetical protein
LADVQIVMASNATILKRVAHVVKGVETLKKFVFVANTVLMIYKHVHALLELLTFGIVLTIVGGVHLKIHCIKKVNVVLFAVHIARNLNTIAHAAKNVAQHHAFAASVVETCASSANAGLQRCFRILCGGQFTITTCSKYFEITTFRSTRRRSSP